MTEQKQPDALRLADWPFVHAAIKDELRRQHAEIESLRAKLDELAKQEHAAFVNEQGFIVERDDMQISSGEKLYLAAGARPVEVVPALPNGWVPCIISFDGDPEEVAYGPQVMMDRLSKWLSKHFEQVAAEKAAPVAVVGPSDLQLLKFYSVTTDAELIAAQAAHIEKLQAKLQQPPSFAPQRVREG